MFVPTDGNNIREDWWRQLFFHDPDIIFLVGQISDATVNELHKQLQPMQILVWDAHDLEALKGKPTITNALPMDVVLENILSIKGKLSPEQSLIRYPLVQGDFAPFIDPICGQWLPESNYQEFATKNLGMLELNFNPINLREYLDALSEIEKWVTPLQLTSQELQISWKNLSGFGGYSLIFSDGLLDDIFIYHALRWSYRSSQGIPTTVLIPIRSLNGDDDYKTLAEWFGSRVGGNTFDIMSYSVGLDSLKNIRDMLKRFLPPRKAGLNGEEGWVINIERCNIDAPVPAITHMKRTQAVDVQNDSYSFEIPKPTFINQTRNPRREYRRWVCDVDLSPGFRHRQGFAPSMFPDLNFILSGYPDRRFLQSNGSRIRIARGKLALAVTLANDVATINIPTDRNVIETACDNAGFKVDSKNGIYYQGMINLLGNLPDAQFLQNTKILELFSHPHLIREDAFTIIEMFQHLRVSKEDQTEFLDWIQILSSKEILLRGYKLECPVCGFKSWYELARVQEHMRCQGCRANFQIPVRMDFAYRLNRLFADRNNHGTITVLLTLLLLHETALDDLIWQADVKLRKVADEIELDIIAMCDGCLIVAECKNTFLPVEKPDENEVTRQQKKQNAIETLKSQLEREINTSIQLGAHLFLFATLEKEVPPEVIEFIQQQETKHENIGIRLVSAEELTKGKFNPSSDPDRHVSIFDIAGSYLLPPPYRDENCSSKDDHSPYGAVSLF